MGNSSNIFDFADNLFSLSSQKKYKIYVINYRGYGKSKGTPTFSTQFSDNSLITNEIIQKQNKLDFVIGFSLGAVFASYTATENKTGAQYLLAPFSNTKSCSSISKNKTQEE